MLPLVVIIGPTATGKSELAVELAIKLQGEIISADSVQIYKHLQIGTAKLTGDEKKGIPHYLLDSLEPDVDFSVAKFQTLARERINEICSRGKLPFLVGGTGLYIQSVVDPYEFPEMDGTNEIRQQYRQLVAEGRGEELYQELSRVDPAAADRLHPHDFRRVSRALEVYHLTGEPISSYQTANERPDPPYDLVMIGLTRNRTDLYRRIEERVERMFASGLVEEVRCLLAHGDNPEWKPFQSLGYHQVIGYLDGSYDLDTTIALTKKATRNYAKRQLTWFRRDLRIHWFLVKEDADQQELTNNIIQLICRSLSFYVE